MGSNTISRTAPSIPSARTTGTTQANPAASNKEMRDLAGFATQLKTASQPAAQQKSSGTQDAKATGSQVLSKISDEFLGQMDLSTTASDRAIANAQKKVDAFVAANPNATEAQVTEEARKALGNTSTSEYIFKSIISKSMNDIMAKVQEQIDDAK